MCDERGVEGVVKCRAKRNRAATRRQQPDPYPFESPKRFWGRQPLLVHATGCLFVFRSVRLRRLTPGRHGLTFANLSDPKAWCLLVFVLVALPPPPVYVLDNEAQPKLSDIRYPVG